MVEQQKQQQNHTVQPYWDSRAAACTHTNMARQYGSFACHSCRRSPSFGWVYQCRQDSCTEKKRTTPSTSTTSSLSSDAPVDELKQAYLEPDAVYRNVPNMSSMSTAERESLYSVDQMRKILAQKEHLANVIDSIETYLVAQVTGQRMEWAEEKEREDEHKRSTVLEESEEETDLAIRDACSSKSLSRVLSGCSWRCCHKCRPAYVERSWLSLNAVADGDESQAADPGWGFCLISKRDCMLNLGLRTDKKQTLDPNAHTETPTRQHVAPQSKPTSLDERIKALRPRKRLFKGMLMSARGGRNRAASDTRKKRSASGPTYLSRAGFGLGFGAGPVGVKGGVAVTEEGVGNLAPDVLSQA